MNQTRTYRKHFKYGQASGFLSIISCMCKKSKCLANNNIKGSLKTYSCNINTMTLTFNSEMNRSTTQLIA